MKDPPSDVRNPQKNLDFSVTFFYFVSFELEAKMFRQFISDPNSSKSWEFFGSDDFSYPLRANIRWTVPSRPAELEAEILHANRDLSGKARIDGSGTAVCKHQDLNRYIVCGYRTVTAYSMRGATYRYPGGFLDRRSYKKVFFLYIFLH